MTAWLFSGGGGAEGWCVRHVLQPQTLNRNGGDDIIVVYVLLTELHRGPD